MNAEHGAVVKRIKTAPRKDDQLQKLPIKFETVIGNSTIKYPDIASLYGVKHNLNDVDNRIYYIIISTTLQREGLKAAHHLRTTKPD